MTDAPSALLLVAAAALIDDCGRVLVQQRPAGTAMAGLWEFPGGKLEPGETAEAALVRELREELGVTVATEDCVPLAFASGRAGARPLLLLLFTVRRWLGEPSALHASALRWATPADLGNLPMPPADVPLVAALARALP
jgi:8-oxo-dGTP diphosphatase